MIRLSFQTEPKGIQSVRHRIIYPKGTQTINGQLTLPFKKKPFVVAYQPEDVIEFKRAIRTEAVQGMGGALPLQGAVAIEIQFIFSPLKGFSKAQKIAIAEGRKVYKTTKPDLTDNLPKGFVDALSGVVFERDQLVCLVGKYEKFYAMKAGIRLKAWTIDEIEPGKDLFQLEF